MVTKIVHMLSFFIIVAILSAHTAVGANLYVEQFGSTEGKPVDNGFVFIDEQYVEPPYIISRKGLELYVNDRKILHPVRHPGEKPLFGTVDPNQLSEGNRQRLLRVIEKARQLYETNLEKGECYIFSRQGGHKKLDIYTTVYNPSQFLWKMRFSWPEFGNQVDALSESLLHVEEFGIKEGEPVDNGFIFIDGQYIDTPYIVTRKGLALFINNRMVQPPMRWSLPSSGEKTTTYSDPNLPATINEDSSSFDPDVVDYLATKNAYLRQRYPKEEAVVRIRDVYRSMPCVKQAELDAKDSEILIVVWADGSVDRVRLVPIDGRRPIKMDRQSILERLETERKNYEERLQKGDYYFFFTQGGKITGGAGAAKQILPKIVSILRSSKPADVKLIEIKDAGLPVDTIIETLVTNFSSSSQLETRLRELTKPK